MFKVGDHVIRTYCDYCHVKRGKEYVVEEFINNSLNAGTGMIIVDGLGCDPRNFELSKRQIVKNI